MSKNYKGTTFAVMKAMRENMPRFLKDMYPLYSTIKWDHKNYVYVIKLPDGQIKRFKLVWDMRNIKPDGLTIYILPAFNWDRKNYGVLLMNVQLQVQIGNSLENNTTFREGWTETIPIESIKGA